VSDKKASTNETIKELIKAKEHEKNSEKKTG
jgi:hypothetical protein